MSDTHEPPKGSGLFLETSYHTVNHKHAQAEIFPDVFEILCGPLRISAFSALKGLFQRRDRRDTQRAAENICSAFIVTSNGERRNRHKSKKKIICRLRATILDHLAPLFV